MFCCILVFSASVIHANECVVYYFLTDWLAYPYGRMQSPSPDVMPNRSQGITRAARFGFAGIYIYIYIYIYICTPVSKKFIA